MEQLILHMFGDYVLQSSWHALNKTKQTLPCLLHCITYSAPFALLTHSWMALYVIFATHFLIDRFGLARYVVWFKEWQDPGGHVPWQFCSLTGYYDPEITVIPKSVEERDQLSDMMQRLREIQKVATVVNPRPIWLRVWLTIVADNTFHLAINFLAITYL